MKLTTIGLPSLCLLACLAPAATAAVIVPDSITPPFEDWSRGHFDSTYAEWDSFTVPFSGPNLPDVGEVSAASATLVQHVPGSFLVGGNIYSPSAAQSFTATLPGLSYGPGYTTRVVAQIRSLGSPLNPASVLLSVDAAPGVPAALSSVSATGSGFSAAEEWLFAWDLPGSGGSYAVDFAAVAAHLSLDRVVIDTFTQSEPFSPLPQDVPEPFTAWLAAVSGGMLILRRSRAS